MALCVLCTVIALIKAPLKNNYVRFEAMDPSDSALQLLTQSIPLESRVESVR